MKNTSDCVQSCTCAPAVVTKYQKRISGPLLDRIDIHIEVPRIDYEKLSLAATNSAKPASRFASVCKRREIFRISASEQRRETLQSIICNADMRIGEVRQFCQLQPEGQSLMRAAKSDCA